MNASGAAALRTEAVARRSDMNGFVRRGGDAWKLKVSLGADAVAGK